jgi:hypothetical protein
VTHKILKQREDKMKRRRRRIEILEGKLCKMMMRTLELYLLLGTTISLYKKLRNASKKKHILLQYHIRIHTTPSHTHTHTRQIKEKRGNRKE